MFKQYKNIKEIKNFKINSSRNDLYQYNVFVGKQKIHCNEYSSYWYVQDNFVKCESNVKSILDIDLFCVEIIGYTPETRYSTFSKGTDLPYINGCSTKQLIHPVRPGDPTFQMLHIPPNTSEQAHHIHSTPRIVYVLEGSGESIVGSNSCYETYNLEVGDLIILDKMVPHHFKTTNEPLTVLPLHIFSSISSEEHNHPMFNGTFKI